ncbi:MAG: DUF423 domain-containing protein [Roseibium sp.]|nr:DUF423 domain-containing protein [Roseibium sp.]MCV0426859.1 DUF423 domain-containing protein [Roseibium sp.]
MSSPLEPTTKLLRFCLVLSGFTGALGVVSLALSAHASASGLLTTAAQMLLFHAPLFLGIGLLSQIRKVPLLPFVAICLTCGLLLFCGDLFSRVVSGQKLFPMSAPLGGILVIISWAGLALNALRVMPK